MKVTIEHERYVPKQRPEKRYVWERAWRAEVLYADRKIILLRAVGSHQKFQGDGGRDGMGWNPKHPDILKLNLRKDGWGRQQIGHTRIEVRSLARLQALVKKHGFVAKGMFA